MKTKHADMLAKAHYLHTRAKPKIVRLSLQSPNAVLRLTIFAL